MVCRRWFCANVLCASAPSAPTAKPKAAQRAGAITARTIPLSTLVEGVICAGAVLQHNSRNENMGTNSIAAAPWSAPETNATENTLIEAGLDIAIFLPSLQWRLLSKHQWFSTSENDDFNAIFTRLV